MALFDKKRLAALEAEVAALKAQFAGRPEPEVLWRLWRAEREEGLINAEAARAFERRVVAELLRIIALLRGPAPRLRTYWRPPPIHDSVGPLAVCLNCGQDDQVEWRIHDERRFRYCFRCSAEVPYGG